MTRGLLSVVLVLVACGGDAIDNKSDGGADLSLAAACQGPLSEVCASGCVGYDMALAEQRARVGHPSCFLSQIGTCGGLRFIEDSIAGLDDRIRYYDAGGTLLAVHQSSDTNAFCSNTSFDRDYGPVPSCARAVTEVVCHCNFAVADGGC